MVLPVLADALVSAGLGVKGVSIFMATLPETPDAAIVLREYEGAPPDRVYADRLSTIERARVQVVVRDRSYETARAKIETVVTALEAIGNEQLGGVTYFGVMALGSPGYLDHDDNDRALVVVNFEVMKGRG